MMINAANACKKARNCEEAPALGGAVAMHLGAGYHSRMNEGRHRELGQRYAAFLFLNRNKPQTND